MAQARPAAVLVSVTTLDRDLSRHLGLAGRQDPHDGGWDLDCTRFRAPQPPGTRRDLFANQLSGPPP